MNRYISEFLGTFFLVFAGTGAVIANTVNPGTVTPLGIGIVFGLIVMVIIYTIGEYSGAHINPAVTIAFWSCGRFAGKDVLPYIIAQCLGAIVASLVLRFLFGLVGSLGGTAPYSGGTPFQSFVLEVILTSLLMYTVMCVSTGSKEVGTLAGIAIGGLIAMEAIFAGPICGASMNPARSLGPALVSGQMDVLWVYIVAPILGALLGVVFWKISRNNPSPVQENI
ncbi:Aquaporin Z 2 [Polystyrenella longa]|uniref:Aquaporin Z 2 n=1 Tax=Polystyrenella longa TaxID=2528007 RepID=A0A518CH39_9PLAN|nr:MIP family channel protein [Polystyrenella longa]QDU78541.1 Aquaporin Z 2 [Polystyrenella longa]